MTDEDIRNGKHSRCSWAALGRALDLSVHTVSGWQKNAPEGMPKSTAGSIDVVEACEWIMATKGYGKGAITVAKAAAILSKLKGYTIITPGRPKDNPVPNKGVSKKPLPPPVPDSVSEEVNAVVITHPRINEQLGIEASLDRARQLELQLALDYQTALDEGDGARALVLLGQWQKCVETMRKLETDILDVLKERRVLVKLDEVKEIFNATVLPIKSRLLLLPIQMASLLENRDAAEIREILDEELRKILTEFSGL